MNNILYIIAIVSMIWVIYDVWAKNTKLSGGAKLIWTICAILFSIVTALVYYFTQKK